MTHEIPDTEARAAALMQPGEDFPRYACRLADGRDSVTYLSDRLSQAQADVERFTRQLREAQACAVQLAVPEGVCRADPPTVSPSAPEPTPEPEEPRPEAPEEVPATEPAGAPAGTLAEQRRAALIAWIGDGMVPGQEYGTGEIGKAIGEHVKVAGIIIRDILPLGLIDKIERPGEFPKYVKAATEVEETPADLPERIRQAFLARPTEEAQDAGVCDWLSDPAITAAHVRPHLEDLASAGFLEFVDDEDEGETVRYFSLVASA